MNLTEKKELILMEYFSNVNHRKILLKELEVSEIEFVCLVVKTKMKLIKEIKMKKEQEIINQEFGRFLRDEMSDLERQKYIISDRYKKSISLISKILKKIQ